MKRHHIPRFLDPCGPATASRHNTLLPPRSYISLDRNFTLTFGPSVKSQDILDAQTSLTNRMLQSVSTNYVDQVTTFREIVLSDQSLPGFSEMLANGTIQFTLSRCMNAFAGYSSIRVSQVRTRPRGAGRRTGRASRNPALCPPQACRQGLTLLLAHLCGRTLPQPPQCHSTVPGHRAPLHPDRFL